MMKKGLRRLKVAFLATSLLGVGCIPASAQDWYRRQQQQQQQQRQLEQQRQQQLREQQRQQQQQQMREQMRQQMREQMRQQMRDQQRQQMRQQQRGQSSEAAPRGGAQRRAGQGAPITNRSGNQAVSPNGVARLNRPLTPGEIRRGFTGRVTPDGRALIKINSRVLAVPVARTGIRTNRSQSAAPPQASRWSASKRAMISADVRKLAAANPKNTVRTGGGGRRPPGGGGGDDGNPPTTNQVKIQFGAVKNQTSHAFRHTDKARLDRKVVKEAIQTDLAKIGDSLPHGHYNGTVHVNGRQLVYSAFKFQDGTINVGSIKPQRR